MTIKRAAGRVAGEPGRGYVLFGYPTPGDCRKWFERWFATEEAACKYADKRGWPIEAT